MGSDMVRAFTQFDQDDSVRVIVITGACKAFCAGADLNQDKNPFGDRGRGRTVQNARDGGGQAVLSIVRCRKVVIAAINGAAGGSFWLLVKVPVTHDSLGTQSVSESR